MRRGLVLLCVVALSWSSLAPRIAQAETALITPPSGSAELRPSLGRQAMHALAKVLKTQKVIALVPSKKGRIFAKGNVIKTCDAPACAHYALESVKADYALVAAAWEKQGGAQEISLTLIDENAVHINAERPHQGELETTMAILFQEVRKRWQTRQPASPMLDTTLVEQLAEEKERRRKPKRMRRKNAWLAGPIVLGAAGLSSILAAGVAKSKAKCETSGVSGLCTQETDLSNGAVKALGVLGAAALAGSITWAIIGAKKRKKPKTQVRLSPSHISLSREF